MGWPRPLIPEKDGFMNTYYPPPPPAGAKISPAVLFTIVILAVLFFISGLLHLLVRFLTKHRNPTSSAGGEGYHSEDMSTSEALQRQLQQLFNLHDSGLDQAFIDALPVFLYGEMVGPREPFSCAVCLCEFSEKDKLRLLPTCSHAFHLNCIDTWLLSNSSCPLCRATLFLDNPVFDFPCDDDEETGKGVLSVRLGKFKRSDGGGSDAALQLQEATSASLDARRCYSMGSYEYVVGNTSLRVALGPRINKAADMGSKSPVGSELEGKRISSVCRGDSYSVSKIWLWQNKGGLPSSSGDVRIGLPSLSNEFPVVD